MIEDIVQVSYNSINKDDEVWCSIIFGDTISDHNGSNRMLKLEAENWAKTEFGKKFFRFGNRFFFSNKQDMIQFNLRWL